MSSEQATPSKLRRNQNFQARPYVVKSVKDPFTGKILGGKYRLNALIARGGMGSVYLARNTETGDLFAIKILLEEMLLLPQIMTRFFNESRAAKRIRHPSVAKTYDVGETTGGAIYMVMEYVNGAPLRKLLQKGPISSARTIILISAIAEGLAAAHDQNIIHRDLKPENIIIPRSKHADSIVKIIDFGIARIIDSPRITTTRHVIGTPQYISPEQAMGGPIDARTDIYSMGVMMYEMLSGTLPFHDRDPETLLNKHIKSKPQTFKEIDTDLKISPKLETLVMSCLEKSPQMRPCNMCEVISMLATL